ncbi:MAG: polysaccharide pyruvyl transferase family protein [Pseudonocardiaceae bacterium]|nr:polysaccharide pyruvyl transferase family protein [Pseudonocardiaceae bacterium]
MLEATSPRYYLVAPAGAPNYGDELIVAGWLRRLAETAPEADVWVDTHTPGNAAVLLAGLHPRVRFVDTLWQLCAEAPSGSDDPWQVASWVREVINHPGMVARLHHGIDALRRVDVFHVLGGGYVNGIWPRHVGLLGGVVEAARLSGGRAAMTGQGLLPVGTETTPLLRALASHFDVVDVRDAASAELLGMPAAGEHFDDAFLGLGPASFDDAADAPEVMICAQADLVSTGTAKLAGMLLGTLRAWEVPPSKVGVVEGIPRVDRDVFALFEHELPGARFYPFCDVWDRGLPVRPTQTWISTRFHVHMAAAVAGAGGVAVSVNPDYYTTKHRSLTSLGSGWTMLEDLDTVPERPVGGGFDAELLGRARQAKRELGRKIYAPVLRRSPEPDADAGAAAGNGGPVAPSNADPPAGKSAARPWWRFRRARD